MRESDAKHELADMQILLSGRGELGKQGDCAERPRLAVVAGIGSHQRAFGHEQRNGMVERVEQVLVQGHREPAGGRIEFRGFHDRNTHRVQIFNLPVRRRRHKAAEDGRDLGDPVRGFLQYDPAGCYALKKGRRAIAVLLRFDRRQKPLDRDARVGDGVNHGLPATRAA